MLRLTHTVILTKQSFAAIKKMDVFKSKDQEFTHSQITYITENFKTIIGEGGFGKVYLGTLANGLKVAVKLLSQESKQGAREFSQEVVKI